jgi:thymidylate synthase ThyX
MQPKQFDSFIKLRTDSHAQWEINQLANAMLELTA